MPGPGSRPGPHTHPDRGRSVRVVGQSLQPPFRFFRGDQLTLVAELLRQVGLAAEDVPDLMKAEVRRSWRDLPLPVIADASALDWLTAGPFKAGVTRVITPHPGEAARMLKTTTAKVEADRTAAVRELSRRLGNCWVVLKGCQTLIENH